MPDLYPNAGFRGDGVSGGSYTEAPFRTVLHTTETEGLPDYEGGRSAPHLTYNPRTRVWAQHTRFGTAARSLANPDGGVQTNRARAIQVEVITYSDKRLADEKSTRMWVGDLPDTAYSDLADFVSWCAGNFDVGLHWPGRRALSGGEANTKGFRMAPSVWESFDGVCSHQHVPENTHWDSGALDLERIVDAAAGRGPSRSAPVTGARGGAAAEAIRRPATYTVQPGDMLRTIAARFGVSLEEVIAANPQIIDPAKIFPGDVLRLPAPVT